MPGRDEENRICGYLEVDEADKRKKFVRRYIVLNTKEGLLQWYLEKPTPDGKITQCGMINLGYITKVDVVTKLKLEYCFVINTPYRPYYMQAHNQAELEEWVEILNDAGKITVPPDALKSDSEEEIQENTQENLENSVSLEADPSIDQSFTYRTEIVGNVVVKKKLTSDGHSVKTSDVPPQSPSPNVNSTHFTFTPGPRDDGNKTILKSGWAIKQGHVRKNWKKRYFVLRTDGFSYYKTVQDREAIRFIPIHEILVAKEDISGEASKLRDNLFLVATTDKIYYIQVETPEEMKSWIESFMEAVNISRRESQKKKVEDDLGFARYDSSREINEGLLSENQRLQKRSSEHSIVSCQDTVANVPHGGHESLTKHDSVPESRKHSKSTHKRSESVATILPTHITGSMYSSKKSQGPLEYNEEDILPRPESMYVTSMDKGQYSLHDYQHVHHRSSTPNTSTRSSLSLASNLDPKVDIRSAVKPSHIRKKKNSGVMFMLNTMLSRKGEKMNKSK